jgi:hypothetical protein
VTACLPRWSLSQLADWASRHGYRALEVAAWPALGKRPFTATHLDVVRLDAGAVRALMHIRLEDRGQRASRICVFGAGAARSAP